MTNRETRQDPHETEEILPESREIGDLHSEFDRFCDEIAEREIRLFWDRRPLDPENNGNGVTLQELMDRVAPKFRKSIKDSMLAVKPMVDESPEPKATFERIVTMMFPIMARNLIEEGYEALRALKKTGIDELTGLPNRKIFKRNLRACVANAERFGQTFSVVMIDLDHFKQINDIHGHQAGDYVLQEFARLATEDVKLRECDAMMRIGGEEFVFVLPNTGGEGACIVADRLRNCVRNHRFMTTNKDGNLVEIPVSASCGVAEYERISEDEPDKGRDIMRRADLGIYVAKGQEADDQGLKANRRGAIMFVRQEMTDERILACKEKFKGQGRSSFPAPRRTSDRRDPQE